VKFTGKRKAHLIAEKGQILSQKSFLGFIALPQEKQVFGVAKSSKRDI
jgi:hypothetical protein